MNTAFPAWEKGILHYGEERRETGAARAERMVREELKRLGWVETTLAEKPKGDVKKVSGGAVAAGHDDDVGMDRGTAADGDQDTSESSPLLAQARPKEMRGALINTKNRPFLR